MYYDPYTPRRRPSCLEGLMRRLLFTLVRLALLIVIVVGILYVLGLYFPPIGAFVSDLLGRIQAWWGQLDLAEWLRMLQDKWANR